MKKRGLRTAMVLSSELCFTSGTWRDIDRSGKRDGLPWAPPGVLWPSEGLAGNNAGNNAGNKPRIITNFNWLPSLDTFYCFGLCTLANV